MISQQLIKIYFSLSHQKQKTTDTNWSSKKCVTHAPREMGEKES